MEFIQYFIDVVVSGELFQPMALAELCYQLENYYLMSSNFIAMFISIVQAMLIILLLGVVFWYAYDQKSIKSFFVGVIYAILFYVIETMIVSFPVLLWSYNNANDFGQSSLLVTLVAYVIIIGLICVCVGNKKSSDYTLYKEVDCKVLMIMYSPKRVEDDSYTTYISTGTGVGVPIQHHSTRQIEAYVRLLIQPLKKGLWAYKEVSISKPKEKLKPLQSGDIIRINSISNDTYENESFAIEDYEIID